MAESNGPRSSHCLSSSRFLFNEVTKILTITSPHKSDACPLQITPLFIISLSLFPPPLHFIRYSCYVAGFHFALMGGDEGRGGS